MTRAFVSPNLAAFASILSTTTAAQAEPLFIEATGLVSMEAENATTIKNWEPVTGISGASGVTMEDKGPRNGGFLEFEIEFARTGTYFVWVRHRKPAGATDDKNDCYASFDGKELAIYPSSACGNAPEGLGTHCSSLCWQSRPKTECVADRTRRVCFTIDSPGRHVFKIISRSPGYLADKYVLVHEDNNGASPGLTGVGPAQTVASGTQVHSRPATAAWPGAQTNNAALRVVAARGSADLEQTWAITGRRILQQNGVTATVPGAYIVKEQRITP